MEGEIPAVRNIIEAGLAASMRPPRDGGGDTGSVRAHSI